MERTATGENTMTDPLTGKKVLVIDDEPDIVTYLTTLLQDNGMQTTSAVDGVEGMARARDERPDLITLDMSMPEQSGVKTLRQLQADEQLCDIPVVIITGVSTDFERFIKTRRQVTPPAGYIAKPIDADDVLRTLREILSA
jgi:CheY-like chemotaxis protein